MKRTLFLLLLCTHGALSLFAQDKIITREGETITGYGTEVGPSTIYYRAESAETSPTLKIAKNLVLMVKFQNGEKVMMNEDGTSGNAAATSTATTASNTAIAPCEDVSIPDEENAAIMARYTPDVAYLGGSTGKDAGKALFLFDFTKGSHVADKNVEISYKVGTLGRSRTADTWGDFIWITEYTGITAKMVPSALADAWPACKVVVKNKTNQTIYVDLANTFFFRGVNAAAYYVPTATTNTSSSSTGAGVNMGAVASAIGVGGSVGKLANGVTVGGEHGNATSTTVFSQRVIPVAPMSSIELQAVELFPKELADAYNFGGDKYTFTETGWTTPAGAVRLPISGVKVGEKMNFNEQASPVTIGSFVTYATTEDMATPYTIQSKLYVNSLMGIKGTKLTNFSDNVRQALGFVVYVKK